jgi:hypothetical protein
VPAFSETRLDDGIPEPLQPLDVFVEIGFDTAGAGFLLVFIQRSELVDNGLNRHCALHPFNT